MSEYANLFRERYGTALLADAAFRAGVHAAVPAPGLRPLNLRSKLAGPAVTVDANNDLVSILVAVHRAAPDDVVVITNGTGDVGLMGDLIGTEAVRKGLGGFLVDGLVRDAVELIDLGLSVLCRGSYPVGPLKVPKEQRGTGTLGVPASIGGVTIAPGMWVFGDADGVVVLDADELPAVFAGAARALEQEEALAREIESGAALGDVFQIESFYEKRSAEPGLDFGAHLVEIDRAI